MSNSHIDSSNKQLAEVIRSMIQHEDKLRNERVTWALIVQGFLIGITGDLWKTGDNEIIIIMITIVAIFLLISFWLTVRENDKAINRLVNIWRSKATELELKNIPITGYEFKQDEEHNRKKNLKKYILPIWIFFKNTLLIWNFLPLILIIYWGSLVYIMLN